MVGYTVTGLIFGDYFVVKNHWNEIKKDIIYYRENEYLQFIFEDNQYYSIYTASLYANHIKNRYPIEGRTCIGLYLEFQAHYIPFKLKIEYDHCYMVDAERPQDSWTARIPESIADKIFKLIAPPIRLF